ncbi:MAG: hypothetical protein WBN75_17070 [Verrucomicrobiia bacterium]
MKRLLKLDLIALLVGFLLALPGCVSDKSKSGGELQDVQSFKDYVVRIYRNKETGMGYFEILRSGKRMHFQRGWKFEVGNIQNSDKTNSLLRIGRSITGEGQPNLVVSEWTGGAHCCFVYYVFQIGDTFKLIDRLDAEHGDNSDFEDLRHNGNLEFVMADWTFAYWNNCFADSPAPTVILRYQDSKYRPDLELMRKPPPNDQDLHLMAENLKAKFANEAETGSNDKWKAPSDLWGKMLDLIYSGNRDSAWKLLDMSWPANHPNKTEFLEEFKIQLATSPFYRDINQPSFQEAR